MVVRRVLALILLTVVLARCGVMGAPINYVDVPRQPASEPAPETAPASPAQEKAE